MHDDTEVELTEAAAPKDDVEQPPPAEEAPSPAERAWDGMLQTDRSDLLVEAKVPALGLSWLLWDQLPIDVKGVLTLFLS